MTSFNYLLEVNLYLVLFCAFYLAFLRNETFFRLNRIYLVSTGLLSFLIPVMQSDWVKSLFLTQRVKQATELIHVAFNSSAIVVSQSAGENGWAGFRQWCTVIYVSGILFFTLKLAWHLGILYFMEKNDTSKAKAYSFFKRIIVSEQLKERETIYNHELVHAREWHSIDRLFFEFIAILNWFNPIVYVYKRIIRHIHEFIADEKAAGSLPSKNDYTLLLVSNAFGISPAQLTNSFYNPSLLKKRIAMLHKTKSGKTAFLKYGLSAPLFAGMLVFSSAVIDNKQPLETISRKIENAALYTEGMLAIRREASKEESVPASSLNVPGTGAVTLKAPASDAGGKNTSTDKRVLQEIPVEEAFVVPPDTIKNNIVDFAAVEQVPEFPGGSAALASFIVKNFTWPKAAQDAGLSGRILLSFVVEQDGSLTNIKVLRDLGLGTGDEAIRMMKTMPHWKPGVQKGKTVRVAFTLPLQLSVGDKKVSSPAQPAKAILTDPGSDTTPMDFAAIEQVPAFPGGQAAMNSFIVKNFKWSEEAKKANLTGKILLTFVVEKDGSLTDIKILRDLGMGTGAEAVRILKIMPRWSPGVQKGRLVRVAYTLPIVLSTDQ